MGSFERNYDKDALRTFTQKEREQLQTLHQRLDEKFDEIASSLAKELGYPEADPRSYEDATEAIDRWHENVTMADSPFKWQKAIKSAIPLQHLLSEHHSLFEEILDIRDEAIEREDKEGGSDLD
jgi:hypothetical protein